MAAFHGSNESVVSGRVEPCCYDVNFTERISVRIVRGFTEVEKRNGWRGCGGASIVGRGNSRWPEVWECVIARNVLHTALSNPAICQRFVNVNDSDERLFGYGDEFTWHPCRRRLRRGPGRNQHDRWAVITPLWTMSINYLVFMLIISISYTLW